MDLPTVRLEAPATSTAPALALRPWRLADAADLAALGRDDALRRWTGFPVEDETSAERWLREQIRGRETRRRFAFAVTEPRADGARDDLVGHVVLKYGTPGLPVAEVGYWTAAHARGRHVASRALRALTVWAFDAFGAEGPARLELVHQVDNAASCRVARACGYDLVTVLPAVPPAHPLDGHLHARTAPAR
ncbi:GNAT family N-acetyltransferase [Streptomyces actuosus]|uniref:GNAT family N-acetyltransferase n=1 Tax=Streptomyces actuosus TaxID=1885 RepID=A0ABS2VIS7_STRAS|nr:GNAT family N-acetyltransferase [Streptomyces actuosus]MBN0042989.1 GNAT family N-acetyltransferase [Streptomyces actuosus]